MTMFVNATVLMVLSAVVCAIVKEEHQHIRDWFSKDRTELKCNLEQMLLFWKEVCKNWIRNVALIATLILHQNVWGMIISMILLIGLSYFAVKKFDIANRIRWEEEKTQKVATICATALALCMLFNRVSLLSVIYHIVTVGAVVIGIIALYWWLITKKNDSDVTNSENDEDAEE